MVQKFFFFNANILGRRRIPQLHGATPRWLYSSPETITVRTARCVCVHAACKARHMRYLSSKRSRAEPPAGLRIPHDGCAVRAVIFVWTDLSMDSTTGGNPNLVPAHKHGPTLLSPNLAQLWRRPQLLPGGEWTSGPKSGRANPTREPGSTAVASKSNVTLCRLQLSNKARMANGWWVGCSGGV